MRRTASLSAKIKAGLKACLKDARVTIAAFTFAVSFFGLLFAGSDAPFVTSARSQLASLFFADDLTPEEIKEKYWDKQLTVLIVPGHDNVDGGTSHKGVPEAEYTAKIGEYLYEYLKNDPNVKPILVRNRNGYLKEFADYFSREEAAIAQFIDRSHSYFTQLSSSKAVVASPPPIQHIRANSRTVKILYGINKWANERGVDVVLHIHLNDYPRKSWEMKYDGFSMYIPDASFPNHAGSRGIAEALRGVFGQYWATSNMHFEKEVILEDSALIAVGSYGSLRAASVLMEYGYIYEPKFQTDIMLKETAFRTYQGLLSYAGDAGKMTDEFAWLAPYEWTKPLSYGVLKNNDVAAFQSALVALGFYPPSGSSLRDCPVSGNFKNCTREALRGFQEQYGISEGGQFGNETRRKLNEVFAASR